MSERVNLGKELPHIPIRAGGRQAGRGCGPGGWLDCGIHPSGEAQGLADQPMCFLPAHACQGRTGGRRSPDRLAVLPAWRETAYFTSKERAGLALTEAITLVASDQVPDAVYAEAAKALNTREIASIEWLAVVINMWNRVAISCRTPVHP